MAWVSRRSRHCRSSWPCSQMSWSSNLQGRRRNSSQKTEDPKGPRVFFDCKGPKRSQRGFGEKQTNTLSKTWPWVACHCWRHFLKSRVKELRGGSTAIFGKDMACFRQDGSIMKHPPRMCMGGFNFTGTEGCRNQATFQFYQRAQRLATAFMIWDQNYNIRKR